MIWNTRFTSRVHILTRLPRRSRLSVARNQLWKMLGLNLRRLMQMQQIDPMRGVASWWWQRARVVLDDAAAPSTKVIANM